MTTKASFKHIYNSMNFLTDYGDIQRVAMKNNISLDKLVNTTRWKQSHVSFENENTAIKKNFLSSRGFFY